ncbi:alpha/beta hydrolase [Pseudonocardia ailaonensis]|uniref:Alpha/beta hydrolase n=1 Tax=Pseudonocardia ailaonensis TaxID=367279 RepID=A0ABN2N1I3_9PSEU
MSAATPSSLPAERPGYPADDELAARRLAAAGTEPDAVPGIAVVDGEVAGVPCRTLEVRGATGQEVLVYLHGGGFRLGSPVAYTAFAGALVGAGVERIVLVDYRLAPEHPFPAGLRDALAVLAAVRSASGTGRVVLAGDSAGAGLALSAALVARDEGLPVDGLVLLSPWLDLRCVSDTFTSPTNTDRMFPLDSARQAAETYLQGHRDDDPLVSPVLADVVGLPPTVVLVGTGESLIGDAAGLASRMARAGQQVDLSVLPDAVHSWPVVTPDSPHTATTVARIAHFVGHGCAARP